MGAVLMNSLVRLYFREIEYVLMLTAQSGALTLFSSWTRYKINRPSFMQRYTSFFESIRLNPSNPYIDADTLKWLPSMYIIVS